MGHHMSRHVRKCALWHVRPAKIQISLHIYAGWSESSLGTFWLVIDAKFLHADNEDSDRTAQMYRLIWVFVGRSHQKAHFHTLRPYDLSIHRLGITSTNEKYVVDKHGCHIVIDLLQKDPPFLLQGVQRVVFFMVSKSKKYRLWSNMALGLKKERNFWRYNQQVSLFPGIIFWCHLALDVEKLCSVLGKLLVSPDLSSKCSDARSPGKLESTG